MSYAIDVNVLLYASDSSSPLSKTARAFLDHCAGGSEVLCLGWPTLSAYLRLATHPAVFASRLPRRGRVQRRLAPFPDPRPRPVGKGGILGRLPRRHRGLAVRGNDVPDAHLAALLRQHDVPTLYTNDRDFRKYPFLKIVDPLEKSAA
ncbi:MAG TPA: TA system VapC family ribonuclease toxin [Thermoanaerobaculia bacterium]|nr:TA system VapC family ribonuclease toxin [Thermoanaerobaculia bacterium]